MNKHTHTPSLTYMRHSALQYLDLGRGPPSRLTKQQMHAGLLSTMRSISEKSVAMLTFIAALQIVTAHPTLFGHVAGVGKTARVPKLSRIHELDKAHGT